MSTHSTTEALAAKNARRTVIGAYVGTALEWYDFFLFGTTAAIVFGPLFFPSSDPVASTIGSFAALAVGFIARPIGAVIFGHYGDKFGRKGALVATVILMGVATTIMGLLPSYETAGVTASVLLVLTRLLQGFAAGGEWGGATAMAVENAPKEKRGLYASIVQIGSPTGTLLSTGAVALVALLPPEDFMSWGWRLPYLASILLVAVAVWLRYYTTESVEFQKLEKQDSTAKAPVKELVAHNFGSLALGVGAYLYSTAGFGIISTFMISYVTLALKMPPSIILNAMLIGAAVQIVVIAVSGKIADRIGATKTVLIGYGVTVLTAFPIFWLVDSKDQFLMTVAMVLAFGLGTIAYAPIGAMFRDFFPSRILYSGMALSANIAGILAGFTPLVATAILGATGLVSTGPALLLLGIAVVSFISTAGILRIIKRRHDSVSTATAAKPAGVA